MSYGQYQLPVYYGNRIAESGWNGQSKDNYKATMATHGLSLEDEIRVLRNRMENLFLEEQSFTSDIVIEISTLLDLKINEYMKTKAK